MTMAEVRFLVGEGTMTTAADFYPRDENSAYLAYTQGGFAKFPDDILCIICTKRLFREEDFMSEMSTE
ncbi:hypothetical protein AKJ16_DCAP17732 [Drosera capensis]